MRLVRKVGKTGSCRNYFAELRSSDSPENNRKGLKGFNQRNVMI